jgi:hypothetical protein
MKKTLNVFALRALFFQFKFINTLTHFTKQ